MFFSAFARIVRATVVLNRPKLTVSTRNTKMNALLFLVRISWRNEVYTAGLQFYLPMR